MRFTWVEKSHEFGAPWWRRNPGRHCSRGCHVLLEHEETRSDNALGGAERGQREADDLKQKLGFEPKAHPRSS